MRSGWIGCMILVLGCSNPNASSIDDQTTSASDTVGDAMADGIEVMPDAGEDGDKTEVADAGPPTEHEKMVASYLACKEAYEYDSWNTCCVLKDGIWVFVEDDACKQHSPECKCGIGYEVKVTGEFGCGWAECVPAYPGTCEPNHLVTGEEASEETCPEEAPFRCQGNGEIVEGVFCSDCPCPMLTSTAGYDCYCGGHFFMPCETDDDCWSGWCVPWEHSWTGKICTDLCMECPQGWSCKGINSGADLMFICYPEHLNLCRPCIIDDDCANPGDWKARCVDFGDDGRYCATSCHWADDCPDGYTCTELPDGPEGPTDHCLPDSGVCECTPRSIVEAATTVCYDVANEFGSCPGEKSCTMDGFTDCVGPEAAAEVCNDLDDDCDGETDEEWPEKGQACDGPDPDDCALGHWVCDDEQGGTKCMGDIVGSVEDICDGLDNDCDGETDEDHTYEQLAIGEACDGVGECGAGTVVCSPWDNAATCSTNLDGTESQAEDEFCDGLDNDCDGGTDETWSCGGYPNAWCQDGACGCTPNDCAGEECGSDGCGGSCGECGPFQTCSAGVCLDVGEMVPVPAGTFWMGCNEAVDDECSADEFPYHEVYLDNYEIDVTEVTVVEYGACVLAGTCPGIGSLSSYCNDNSPEKVNHPENCVEWNEAAMYCQWAGKRLCTEAEWEKGARGTDGRKYPWGNAAPSCEYAVMSNGCGEMSTWPVGSKLAGASPYGCLDMAGNVWEWTADWYGLSYYSVSSPSNPQGPAEGIYRVKRGGDYYLDGHHRASDRTKEFMWYKKGGFRCCR